MWDEKETTAPNPSVGADGEQSHALARKDSIAGKSRGYNPLVPRGTAHSKGVSGALTSIGVVTPHCQSLRPWQGLRPLYPRNVGGAADA